MLSSNSSSCNHNPNYTPFSENDINSFTSTSEDPNFFFGLFPHSPHLDSPWLDLPHVYLNSPPNYSTAAPAPPIPGFPTTNKLQKAGPGKKDRHSKINTARGPRDRRMRLSLDIARRFFDLQDLLGFDKASRTVDWLLRSSSSAIRALRRGMPGRSSSTSEDYGGEGATAAAKSRRGKRGKRGGAQQKRATVARESRRKARERARERTSQKRRLNAAPVSLYHGAGVQLVEDFSSDQGQPPFCLWDSIHLQQTHTLPFFPQDDQEIEEFEFNGKPWEAYNSFNMSG